MERTFVEEKFTKESTTYFVRGPVCRCSPKMHTTLLNTYPSTLIATILKALPEIPLEYDQILKGGRFWDDVNGGYLPEDLVLAARREEID